MMLENSFGFWSIKRQFVKHDFYLNLMFETKNRLRLTASFNASKIERISHRPLNVQAGEWRQLTQ